MSACLSKDIDNTSSESPPQVKTCNNTLQNITDIHLAYNTRDVYIKAMLLHGVGDVA